MKNIFVTSIYFKETFISNESLGNSLKERLKKCIIYTLFQTCTTFFCGPQMKNVHAALLYRKWTSQGSIYKHKNSPYGSLSSKVIQDLCIKKRPKLNLLFTENHALTVIITIHFNCDNFKELNFSICVSWKQEIHTCFRRLWVWVNYDNVPLSENILAILYSRPDFPLQYYVLSKT